MKQIWALSSGAYSDYGVEVIIADEALADKAKEKIAEMGVRDMPTPFLETFRLLDEEPEHWYATQHVASSIIEEDGTVVDRNRLIEFHVFLPDPDEIKAKPEVIVHKIPGSGNHTSQVVRVSGYNKEAVLKTLSDRTAEMIANSTA